MSQEFIKTAAQLAVLGLDPMRFLETKDGLERSIMVELGRHMAELKGKMDHSLAVDIANQVGKLFKR